MFDEVGSEYWKADITNHVNEKIPGAVYTASGRSAQSLIIKCAEIENKRALLPAYTCQHIIEPFAWYGWQVDFYDIHENLAPNLDSFRQKLALNPGCIIVEGYYGFPTAENLVPLLIAIQKTGTVIIEDITHSFLNAKQQIYDDADYIFCSLRKWSGISDGGYAISIKGRPLFTPTESMVSFTIDRFHAREKKAEYVRTLDSKTKQEFLDLYAKAETLLDSDIGIYAMSEQAFSDYIKWDNEFIKSRRRENFAFYLSAINNPFVRPIFNILPDGVVPIMFPVYVKEVRNILRNNLIRERVYCPVHWPAPIQLDEAARKGSLSIYDNIMSIPCDQRYQIEDIRRVVDIINKFTPEGE